MADIPRPRVVTPSVKDGVAKVLLDITPTLNTLGKHHVNTSDDEVDAVVICDLDDDDEVEDAFFAAAVKRYVKPTNCIMPVDKLVDFIHNDTACPRCRRSKSLVTTWDRHGVSSVVNVRCKNCIKTCHRISTVTRTSILDEYESIPTHLDTRRKLKTMDFVHN